MRCPLHTSKSPHGISCKVWNSQLYSVFCLRSFFPMINLLAYDFVNFKLSCDIWSIFLIYSLFSFSLSGWICHLSFQAGDRAVSPAPLFISEVSAEAAVAVLALIPFCLCGFSEASSARWQTRPGTKHGVMRQMLGWSLNLSHFDCWQIPATSASFSLSFCLLCFVTGNANALDLAPLVLLSCWQLWECCSELLGQCFPGDVCGTFVSTLFSWGCCCFILKAWYLQALIALLWWALRTGGFGIYTTGTMEWFGLERSSKFCIFSRAGWSPGVNWDNGGSHKMYFCFYSSETSLGELIRLFL